MVKHLTTRIEPHEIDLGPHLTKMFHDLDAKFGGYFEVGHTTAIRNSLVILINDKIKGYSVVVKELFNETGYPYQKIFFIVSIDSKKRQFSSQMASYNHYD